MLPEANTRRQEGKYPMIKVLRGGIRKLVLILYKIGNMQSAILLSFVTFPPYRYVGINLAPVDALLYQSIYVVYNVWVVPK